MTTMKQVGINSYVTDPIHVLYKEGKIMRSDEKLKNYDLFREMIGDHYVIF